MATGLNHRIKQIAAFDAALAVLVSGIDQTLIPDRCLG